MEIGNIIGYIGVVLGLAVPVPQLLKLARTGSSGVSLGTYVFLCLALVCYLIHAIYIGSPVFTISQSVNLATNTAILVVLTRRKYDKSRKA